MSVLFAWRQVMVSSMIHVWIVHIRASPQREFTNHARRTYMAIMTYFGLENKGGNKIPNKMGAYEVLHSFTPQEQVRFDSCHDCVSLLEGKRERHEAKTVAA